MTPEFMLLTALRAFFRPRDVAGNRVRVGGEPLHRLAVGKMTPALIVATRTLRESRSTLKKITPNRPIALVRPVVAGLPAIWRTRMVPEGPS